MGIIDKAKKFIRSSSKIHQTCEQDPNTNIVTCKRSRILEDGTEQPLAIEQYQITSDCKAVAIHQEEFEEGELDKLEKGTYSKIKQKCLGKKPGDY